MVTINLNLDEVKALSRTELENYLKESSNYETLKDEFKGKFICTYLVNDTIVAIYNEVEGNIVALLSKPDNVARIFAMKSEILLNNIDVTNF